MNGMTPPGRQPSDDLPHDLSQRPDILENYQWYGHDPISNVSIIGHYGTLPGDAAMWHAVLYVHLPDGTALVSKQVGAPAEHGLAGTPNHNLRCIEPFHEWTLSFYAGMKSLRPHEMEHGLVTDGQSQSVRLDLTFSAAGPVWDPSAGDGPAEGWSDLHHEQAMRMTGSVTIDGDSIHIRDGFAYRDHSVGPRDLRNIGRHSWNNGRFPSGRSFGSLRVGHLDGTFTDRAYLVQDDSISDAAVIDIPLMYGTVGDPLEFTISLASDDQPVTIHGKLVQDRRSSFAVAGPAEFALGTPIDEPDSYFLLQAIVEWEWDGEIGYGMSDRGGLVRLHVD